MRKKPWKKLTLLLLLTAALSACVLAVNSVGNQLQYLVEAPVPQRVEQSGEEQPQQKPNQALMDLSKTLDSRMDEISGNISDYTLTGIVDQQDFQPDLGSLAQGRLELLGPGAFVTRPQYLRYGRLFFPEELKQGDAVILLDEQLALKLFNISDPLGRTVFVGDKGYRVVGVLRHTKQVGDLMDAGAYIPLASVTGTSLAVDALMVTATPIPGTGASVGFKTAVNSWKSGGTFIDLGKESMGAKLWLRLLIFLVGMTLTLRTVRFLNRRVHDVLRDDRELLKSSYAVRQMHRFVGQALVLGAGYLLCGGALALLMQYVIEPVYTFPEWVPAILVEWEEIGNAFWKCWQTPSTLMELRSPEFMRLRFFGLMIQLSSAAIGLLLALLYGRLRTREEREVESMRGMYRMGVVVSTLRTHRPAPLLDMDYIPAEEGEQEAPVALARILNARRVLEQLPNTTAHGSFVMEVTDEQIPQNNGRYLITCTPEGKTVTETDRNYDLQMNMRALTALVYGKKNLRDFLEDAEGFDMTQRCPTMDGLFSHHLTLVGSAKE